MPAIPTARLDVLSLRVLESDSSHDILDGAGWLIQGSGAGRIAASHDCLPDGTLVKFAMNQPSEVPDPFIAGTLQNKVEHAVWISHLALRAYCTPIIAIDTRPIRSWQLVPTCGPSATQAVTTAMDALDAHGYTSGDLFAPDHWVSFNSQPVCLDYGYAHPSDVGDCPLADLAATIDPWRTTHQRDEQPPTDEPLPIVK
jgi:hypothetical protein